MKSFIYPVVKTYKSCHLNLAMNELRGKLYKYMNRIYHFNTILYTKQELLSAVLFANSLS